MAEVLEAQKGRHKAEVLRRTRRLKVVKASGRYEFYGRGKDLYKAVVKALKVVPKGFVTVSAKEFVEHPERYGLEGEVEREVES